ncbi:MAG: hypothetical protein WD425_11500 [Nitrospirales bacterium]
MNVLWIAAITVFVFLGKVLWDRPWAYRFTGLAGIGLIVCGVGLLVG